MKCMSAACHLLPEDVQLAMYRTVPGLKTAGSKSNAYAIEYDCIDKTAVSGRWNLRR